MAYHEPSTPVAARLAQLGRPIRVALVGCCKEKRQDQHEIVGGDGKTYLMDTPMPARDLYLSPLFKAALQHAERTADLTIILSAFYEAIHPNTHITNYDRTLKDGSYSAYRAFLKLRDYLPTGLPFPEVEVTVLCGHDYSDGVYVAMSRSGMMVLTAWREPLKHLGVGDRLGWFKKHAQRYSAREEARRRHGVSR